MPYEKVEFSFPDPDEDKKVIEVESSSAMEVDISGKSVSSEEAPESKSTEDADDAIMTNAGQKKRRFVNARNLRDTLNSSLTRTKD